MLEQHLTTIIGAVEPGDALLKALETVLAQYDEWKKTELRIQSQIAFDFQLRSLPSQDQVCDALQQFGVFAVALRLVADQLEAEVEESTNQFYDWLYD